MQFNNFDNSKIKYEKINNLDHICPVLREKNEVTKKKEKKQFKGVSYAIFEN